MANVKRCSTALVIKEMQIKLRCHFLPINLAKIFFNGNSHSWGRWAEKRPSYNLLGGSVN